MAKILLVEDDKSIGDSIVDGLSHAGHTVEWVDDGEEGAQRLRLYEYDVVILDWNLPGRSGVDICQRYREKGGQLPIIMLTARRAEDERVQGLDAGADDYLLKPFSLAELQARIRAVLRRHRAQPTNVIAAGDLSLDVATGTVQRAGIQIELLAKELALLEFFMSHPGQFFDAGQLLNSVWSSETDSTEDAARKCVSRLKKKLELSGRENPIMTVKGRGYRLDAVK